MSPTIQFAAGRADIAPDDPLLADLVRVYFELRREEWCIIEIEGHTAQDCLAEFNNVPLSLRRAEAVRDELVRLGIEPTRLRVVGRGSSRPKGRAQRRAGWRAEVPCEDEIHRRVKFHVVFCPL